MLFMVAAMFAKTAILAFYRRIFGLSRRSRILILPGLAFTVVMYLAILIVVAVGCVPQPADWATGLMGSGWLSPQYLERMEKYSAPTTAASGIGGAVIDIYILLLPLLFVSQLQISRSRKAGLAAVFILGSS